MGCWRRLETLKRQGCLQLQNIDSMRPRRGDGLFVGRNLGCYAFLAEHMRRDPVLHNYFDRADVEGRREGEFCVSQR